MKLIQYLLSERSNRLLLIVVIALLNLVAAGWYARLDLTAGDTYSLSEVSRQTISSLEAPLTVSVFFSADLPAPYNGVARYLKDLLAEYDSVGNENFHYRFINVGEEDGQEIAESYGIYSIQVQEVKSDEFQSRNVYMGIALSYGSGVEQLPEVSATDGLEYRLTTTISRMVGTVSAAASLEKKIQGTLYYSPDLAEFGIAGFDQLEQLVAEAVGAVNAANNDIVEFSSRTVRDSDEATALSRQYGFQRIAYADRENPAVQREATVGMVLKLDDRFESLPLDLTRQVFGGYALAGLARIEERIGQALEGLLNENPPVGYVIGHGERGLDDTQNGAALFRTLSSDLYELVELNLAEEEVPLGISTIVINGPRSSFSESELYVLDQFLLAGGRLLFFLDPFQQIQPPQNNGQGMPPVYLPLDTGLSSFVAHFGITAETNYLLDQNSYQAQGQFGPMQYYHIPILEKQSLDQKHPITRNLGKVVLLSSSRISPADTPGGDVEFRTLASSSDAAWIMEGRVDLNPMSITPPPVEEQQRQPLIVLAEGEFESFFNEAPPEALLEGGVEGSRFIERSIRPGKVLVAGTSELTGAQLLDPEGRSPNAILVLNMLDYLNGNEAMPLMRSKGLNLIPLGESSPEYRSFVKGFAMAGLPLLVLLAGVVVWRLREARRRTIKELFEHIQQEAGV